MLQLKSLCVCVSFLIWVFCFCWQVAGLASLNCNPKMIGKAIHVWLICCSHGLKLPPWNIKRQWYATCVGFHLHMNHEKYLFFFWNYIISRERNQQSMFFRCLTISVDHRYVSFLEDILLWMVVPFHLHDHPKELQLSCGLVKLDAEKAGIGSIFGRTLWGMPHEVESLDHFVKWWWWWQRLTP